MNSFRVSLVMLTFNHVETLARTMAHNYEHAGSPIDELIWVDNGSTENVRDVMAAYQPDVSILNKVNLGVSRGYNRGYALATGDYVVIIDADMLMPDGWLAIFRKYLEGIPNTGVACIFHDDRAHGFREVRECNGLVYHPCRPWGRRIVPRELLFRKIGFLREDFGLYGCEDLEWADRAVRVCKEQGLLTYSIPGVWSEHLGDARHEDPDYRTFKAREGADPLKRALVARCRDENNPYYNPYA